ncbi:hypothetical protein LOTGIDRAFT_176331, partial [Lottia gigantea]
THHEKSYQEYVANKAKERSVQLENYYEQIVTRTHSELNSLKSQIASAKKELEAAKKKYNEASEKLMEKSRQNQKLQSMYDTLRRRYKTKKVTDIRSFDTYEDEAPLIRFLKKTVPENGIILVASFDDASQNLKEDSRRWLKLYGSKAVTDLSYREGFVMVGQRGLNEGLAVEFISYAGVDGEWPKALENSFCVPKKITGRQIIPDPEVHRNDERRGFCKKYKGYYELCD